MDFRFIYANEFFASLKSFGKYGYKLIGSRAFVNQKIGLPGFCVFLPKG